MARIHLVSDVHLEFAPYRVPDVGADIMVAAGDTCPGLGGLRWLGDCARKYAVVAVAGNHEYYGYAFPRLTEMLTSRPPRGVHFLERGAVVLNGVRILGTTLWTDFELFGRTRRLEVMNMCGMAMNDYLQIRYNPERRLLEPKDTLAAHRTARAWLEQQLDTPFDGPTVVVTHHAPTPRSVHDDDMDDVVSAAYASDLPSLMDGRKCVLWIHGHTHHAVDYEVNGTRIICNPCGYPSESTGFQNDLVITV